MVALHVVLGVSVLVLSLVAGIWGGIAWIRQRASIHFWYWLRAAQAAVAIQVLLGTLLVFLGHDAGDRLHYLYGALPLIVSLFAEGARAGAAAQELGETDFEDLPPERQRLLALAIVRRETGIMALSCFVIFFLALRAAATSPKF
jgi:heme A synthase